MGLSRFRESLKGCVYISIWLISSSSLLGIGESESGTKGFSANHVFEQGIFGENIDALNGGLTLTIPIGRRFQLSNNLGYQLNLFYNSRIWEHRTELNFGGPDVIYPYLAGKSPVGTGFQLNFGRAFYSMEYDPDFDCIADPEKESNLFFQGPDGSLHLIPEGSGTGPMPRFLPSDFASGRSFDGSYLQTLTLPFSGSSNPQLWTADGLQYTFGHLVNPTNWDSANGNWEIFGRRRFINSDCSQRYPAESNTFSGWYTTRVEDRESDTYLDISYQTGSLQHCIDQIIDSDGRVINFTCQDNWLGFPVPGGVVTSITLPAFGNDKNVLNPTATTEIRFSYEWISTIDPVDGQVFPDQLYLKKLKVQHDTDGGGNPLFYSFQFDYDRAAEGTTFGMLNRRMVPTGAVVEYDYNTVPFSSMLGANLFGNPRVKSRGTTPMIMGKTLWMDCDETNINNCLDVGESWTYQRDSFPEETNPYKVQVTDPLGNATVYYYLRTRSCDPGPIDGNCPSSNKPDDDVAPDWDDGLNYLIEYYLGTPTNGHLLRRVQRDYTSDPLPLGEETKRSKANIRTFRETTTYLQDSGRQSTIEFSDWDNFGHWKEVKQSGTGISEIRSTRTEFVPDETNWFLKPFEYVEKRNGSRVVDRTDMVFVENRLYLGVKRSTVPPSLSTPRPTLPLPINSEDIVGEYCYDASPITGEPLTECNTLGTDGFSSGQVISTTARKGDNSSAYTTNYEYSPKGYLARRSSQGLGGLQFLNLENDLNTGLPLGSRDTAGVQTTFNYDQLGRLRRITPSPGKFETLISVPNIRLSTVTQGDPATNDYIFSEHHFDTLGRVIEVKKRHHDGSQVGQKTAYDVLGNVTEKSELVKLDSAGNFVLPLPKTMFDYKLQPGEALYHTSLELIDPLGRVHKTTFADGHQTLAEYLGLRSIVTVKNVRGLDDFQMETLLNPQTTYTRDPYGRLIGVDSTGEAADATYSYDSRDNLIEVILSAPDGTTQTRTFEYDGLNQLTRATNPENGTTLYEGYDALGRLVSLRDAKGQQFSNAYDPAGRLTTVRLGPPTTGILLAEYVYDEAGSGQNVRGSSGGKLTTVRSYDDSGNLLHTRENYFLGLNGRLSKEKTIFPGWVSIPVLYSYDPFGSLKQLTYPDEGARGTEIRDIQYTYQNGFLNKVENLAVDPTSPERVYVEEIKYNPAGGIQEILTGGNVRTIVTPDGLNRPQSITIQYEPQVAALSGGGSEGNQQFISDLLLLASRRYIGDIPTCQVDCGGGGGDPPPPPPPPDGGGQLAVYYQSGTYNYDGARNITSIGANDYFYDESNQLVRASTWFEGTNYDIWYDYDPFGNMIFRDENIGGGLSTTQSFFVDYLTNQILDLNGIPFSYDSTGNLIKDGQHDFQFDSRNRMQRVFHEGSGQDFGPYGYDASGYRITKDSEGSGVRTYYVRDGSGRVLSEFRQSLEAGIDPVWSKDYIYAGGRLVALLENESPQTPTGLQACGISSCEKLSGETILNDAGQIGIGDVTLYWQPNPDIDFLQFKVYRKTNNPSYDFIGSTFFPQYQDTDVGPGTWHYMVLAVDTAFNPSNYSVPFKVEVGDSTPPEPPTNLVAVPGDGMVELTWTASIDDGSGPNKDVIGYAVYRRTETPGYPATAVNHLPLNGTPIQDIGLQNGTTYYYQVKAIDASGNYSNPSLEDFAQPVDLAPPSPPSGVKAQAGCEPAITSIRITWSLNPPGEGVTEYRIYRNSSTTPLTTVGPTETSYDDTTSSTPGLDYSYVVTAVDGSQNESLVSNEAVARLRSTTLPTVDPLSFAASPGHSDVNLTWFHPVAGSEIEGFHLYRRSHRYYGDQCAGFERISTIPVPTSGPPVAGYGFEDTVVFNFSRYDYKITAYDVTGTDSIDTFLTTNPVTPLEAPQTLENCGLWSVNGNWLYWYFNSNRNSLEIQERSPGLSNIGNNANDRILFDNYYELYDSTDCTTDDGKTVSNGANTKIDTPFLFGSSSSEYRRMQFSYSEWFARYDDVTGNYLYDVWSDLFFDGFTFSDPTETCVRFSTDINFWNNAAALPNCDNVLPNEVQITAISGTENGLNPGEIQLQWTPVPEAAEYKIYDKVLAWDVDAGSAEYDKLSYWEHAVLARVAGDQTSMVLSGFDQCRTRSFIITAVDALGRESLGRSPLSHLDSFEPTPPYPTVQNAIATPGPGIGEVTANWDHPCPSGIDSVGYLQGFNVYRLNNGTNLYEKINSTLIPTNTTAFKDSEVATLPAGTYEYKVTSVDRNSLESNYSAPTSSLTGTGSEPGLPRGFKATNGPGLHNVNLVWSKSFDANTDHYKIYRRLFSETIPTEIATVAQPAGSQPLISYNDDPGIFGVYYYQIKGGATETVGSTSVFYYSSPTAELDVNLYPISPPQNLIVTASTEEFEHSAELRWCPNNPSENIVGYDIWVHPGSDTGSSWPLSKYFGTTTETSIRAPIAGPCGTWDYSVTAVSADGRRSGSSINSAYTCELCTSESDPEGDACTAQPACVPLAFNHSGGEEEFYLAQNSGQETTVFTPDLLPNSTLDGLENFLLSPHRSTGQASPAYTISFLHLDHLGSPRVITDISGNLLSEHHYLPFGEETPTMASPNTHQFTGQERDKERGLDYMFARYYGPKSLFRFESPDPGNDIQIGNPLSWNKYSYVKNRPINYVDIFGEKGISAIPKGFLIFEVISRICDPLSMAEGNVGVGANVTCGTIHLTAGTLSAALAIEFPPLALVAIIEYHNAVGNLQNLYDFEQKQKIVRRKRWIVSNIDQDFIYAVVIAVVETQDPFGQNNTERTIHIEPTYYNDGFFTGVLNFKKVTNPISLADYYSSNGYTVYVDGVRWN